MPNYIVSFGWNTSTFWERIKFIFYKKYSPAIRFGSQGYPFESLDDTSAKKQISQYTTDLLREKGKFTKITRTTLVRVPENKIEYKVIYEKYIT